MKDILKFQQMYRDGKMGRRDFMAALGALGVGATAAAGFLTSAKSLAATPQKGGTARYANNLHGPDDQMDPMVFTSGIDYTRGRATYKRPDPDARRYGSRARTRRGMVGQRRCGPSTPSRSERAWSSTTGRRSLPRMSHWTMTRHIGEESPSTAKALLAAITEWKVVDSPYREGDAEFARLRSS